MKFYMTPGSCSTGIHVLLEECELFFEAHVVNLLTRQNMTPEFLALNPRGSVPTLVLDDGTALTSFEAIATWLADTRPKKRLLPEDPAEAERVLDVLRYAVEVVHGDGFTRVFVADRYADGASEQSAVEREGRAAVARGFERLAAMMRRPDCVSERFSVADAALLYLEFWADRIALPLPAKCQAHLEAMLQRPAVRQVLGEEGYASLLRKYPLRHAELR